MIDYSKTSQQGNILFPYRLHEMLDDCERDGKSHIVSWLPNGKAFKVHIVAEFVESILPDYFKQSKYKSYQRQLNLWGFERVTANGPEKGAYFHKNFIKGKPALCRFLRRQRARKSGSSSVSKKSDRRTPVKTAHSRSRKSSSGVKENTFNHPVTRKVFDSQDVPSLGDEEEFSFELLEDFEPASSPQLSFEGCQFFPLETEKYEELSSLVLSSEDNAFSFSERSETNTTGGLSRRLSFLSLRTCSAMCAV
eukprot:Nitzschia sp. Nitz4//scaffold117_size69655//13594//14419//NITZ4_006016-RA/size69655-processed-gene-0.100-mRNA-1//-1//CDS//3329533627//4514//frame0